jgi:hypothetical protein
MTNTELITDEMIKKAIATARYYEQCSSLSNNEIMRKIILSAQDDLTRPVYNLLQGYKQDVEAYKLALEQIRQFPWGNVQEIADKALKGDYHKTDFTEFCQQNPITDYPT